jgi:CelD/BcsL family acetyltransferase involved in cellulose biosynthesis
LIYAPRKLEAQPYASARLRLERISDPLGFAALRSEWDELLDSSRAGIFTAWEWLYPWFCRIGHNRELQILATRNELGELTGIMPLSLQRRRAFGRSIRRLAFLGDARVGSEYLDLIARKGSETSVAAEVAGAIRASEGWDVLDLLDLPESSPVLSAFREAFSSAEYTLRIGQRSVCPYQSFAPGETFDRYLRRTARRDNYLRRRRWLEAQPGFRIEREGRPEQLTLPVAEFFRLHTLRWKGDSDGVAGPAVEAFHRDAALLLAERGQVRFYTLKLGDRALASVYAILHGRKFVFYQSGYDPEWGSKSVGLVLLADTFRDCIESGFTEYDFLRGTEPYKLDWVTQCRRTIALRIVRKGGAGEWLDRQERAAAVARNLAKSLLPDRWVERIRSRRRRSAQRS